MSTVRTCSCKHEYQDATYGKGMRVSNIMKNGDMRCTVCGSIAKGNGSSSPAGKKAK